MRYPPGACWDADALVEHARPPAPRPADERRLRRAVVPPTANEAATAHGLGGATEAGGVIDRFHRVPDRPGLDVVDGAAVDANLGVDPSLTIAAQAEWALAHWPARGEPDPRPPLGAAAEPVAAS